MFQILVVEDDRDINRTVCVFFDEKCEETMNKSPGFP